MRRRIELFGLLDPAAASSFPNRPRGLPVVSVCRLLAQSAHPLVRLPFPPESSNHRRPGISCPGTSLGLQSLIAASTGGVHIRGLPGPAKFRPRRFSRPRRLAPPPTFAGLFHPATTSRVRSPRVSPVTTAVRARRPPLPSCSLARPSCRRLPDGAGRTHPLSRALLRDAGPLHGTGV
jgi:hypothetical protein